MRAVGAQQTSGSRGRAAEPPTAPFRALCSVPSPTPFALADPSHDPSSRPRSPTLPLASSSNSCGALQPSLLVPAAPPALRCGGAGLIRSRRARRPRRRTSWAPRPRPFLESAALLLPGLLFLTSSPPARLQTPGSVPKGPGPPAAPSSGSLRPPDSPSRPASVSVVLACAAPEPRPKLAAKLAPPARRPPLTGGKGRCARARSPRRPPPARCMSRRLGSARWRARSSLGGRLSPGAAGPVPVARPGGLDRARPRALRSSRGRLGARLGPGPGCAPRLPLTGLASQQRRSARRRPRGPAPPGAAASAPPRRAHPAACTCAAPGPSCPPTGRAPGPRLRSPGLYPQTQPDTWGQVQSRRKQAAPSPGFEPEAYCVCDLGPVNFENPSVYKVRPAPRGRHKRW